MREICCPTCLCIYAIPELVAAKYEENHKTFYCPQGHSQNYPQLTVYDMSQKEIKSKNYDITQLKKENRRLRSKKGEVNKNGKKQ